MSEEPRRKKVRVSGIQLGYKIQKTRLHEKVVEEVFQGQCPTYNEFMERVFNDEDVSIVYEALREEIAHTQHKNVMEVGPKDVYPTFCFRLFGETRA